MLVIKIILWSMVIMYLWRSLRSIISIFLEKIYLKRLSKVEVDGYKDFYVLLPALHEQKLVRETIDWFSKMTYPGKIKFIIITSEKEKLDLKDDKDTTSYLVDEVLKEKKIKNFYHLHYPFKEGNKSSQLNYAVREILKSNPDLNNTYISVFDFDSKPDLDTFTTINKVSILCNNPDVINQVPISFKNYEELSNDSSNSLLLLSSLIQNVRSCGIEKFNLLVESLTNKKMMKYCMGACLHIKLKTLIDNHYFPYFVDDLTLGYRLCIKEYRFSYAPSSNLVLIPNKLSSCFNQSVLIFKGVLTSFTEIRKAGDGHIKGKMKILQEGIINVSELTILPLLTIVYVIVCLVNHDINLLFVLLIGINYIWSITSYINLKVMGIKDKKITSLLAILLSPVWFICKNFGALIYYKRYLLSKIRKNEIRYYKTVR